jgi:hypothetical protein
MIPCDPYRLLVANSIGFEIITAAYVYSFRVWCQRRRSRDLHGGHPFVLRIGGEEEKETRVEQPP